MIARFVRAGILSALCALPLAAQVVGTSYGSSGLFDTPIDPNLVLQLNTNVGAQNLAELRLVGGSATEVAVLALSGGQAALPLGCCATIYVADPIVPVYGRFDDAGCFAASFAPNQPALKGMTFYAQGVDLLSGGGLALSQGMAVSFL